MGRVDDAMRRAEAVRGGESDWASTAVIEPEAVEVAVAAEPPDAKPEPQKPDSLFEHIDARLAEKIVVDDRMVPGIREQYRRLAAALHQAQAVDGVKVVMIASALEKKRVSR
jgi:hypothetical protein